MSWIVGRWASFRRGRRAPLVPQGFTANSVSEQELLNTFGDAVLTHNAALFVGAGLSKVAASNVPDWAQLVAPFRARAGIPESLNDYPLVAQYFVQSPGGGRDELEGHIAQELTPVAASNLAAHRLVASLPVSEIWTTNYDRYLEEAMPDAQVVISDEDLRDRRTAWERRILKAHGSLDGHGGWSSPPVITRADYETFESTHPRLWSSLTATFLTRAFLFLGFSFADPNVEVLLRLARTRLELGGGPEHFTVMRRPNDRAGAELFGHRVRDLERSGVAVLEIDSYQDLVPLLSRLVRRTRPSRLFISGSGEQGKPVGEALGRRLAPLPLQVVSLAGDTGMAVSYSLGRALRAADRYDPERVLLLFRQKDEPPPELTERTGTVIYSERPAEDLRRWAIDSCRAMVIIGGASTTASEARIAEALEVPIIPIGTAGGTGHEIWRRMSADLAAREMGGGPVNPDDFAQLNSDEPEIAVSAAERLITQAMFLQGKTVSGRQ